MERRDHRARTIERHFDPCRIGGFTIGSSKFSIPEPEGSETVGPRRWIPAFAAMTNETRCYNPLPRSSHYGGLRFVHSGVPGATPQMFLRTGTAAPGTLLIRTYVNCFRKRSS